MEAAVVTAPKPADATQKVLEVHDLKKYFPARRSLFGRSAEKVHAVDGVSFDVGRAETFGLVGESGCGKSTVGRTIVRLLEPTGGTIVLNGEDISKLGNRELRPHRRKMQIVFQDPASSLDPRQKVGDIVGELLQVHTNMSRAERREAVIELFHKVGLQPSQIDNYPHEFSGGQRQRIGIARALSLNPDIIICDESVSALDVSIQAQIINLLHRLQQDLGISYLFIAHDLGVVEHISHRVAVMYLGRIVEIGAKRQIFADPQHPYTQSLLAAVPIADPSRRGNRQILEGDVPSPINRPTGCHFHTRCPIATDRCKVESPQLREIQPGHQVSCHYR
jgi:peptide/nickel transport system ATP-binding protein/oligopeptide transport system ATP-binding protein